LFRNTSASHIRHRWFKHAVRHLCQDPCQWLSWRWLVTKGGQRSYTSRPILHPARRRYIFWNHSIFLGI